MLYIPTLDHAAEVKQALLDEYYRHRLDFENWWAQEIEKATREYNRAYGLQ